MRLCGDAVREHLTPVLTKRAERSEARREFAVGLPHYDFKVNVTIALGESRPSELMHHTSS